MPRLDGRTPDQMREVLIQPDYFRKNDALVSFGATKVLCYASIEQRVPHWLVGAGSGWLTADYNMLPSAGTPRQQRERSYPSGRTHEIQRLIGRSLRAAVDLSAIPPLTIHVDCDVILADGGTRTASITGGMVALANLIGQEAGKFKGNPLLRLVSAVSVGIYSGEPVLDLNYVEDRDADVDANVVGMSDGDFAEVQATSEHGSYSREQLDQMLDLAAPALKTLYSLQREAITDHGLLA
ncbi:MAG TPA: ribonuclease PH [Firmicutes bacterium]|nr:ribonuclease PH [Bacillota bacterium]